MSERLDAALSGVRPMSPSSSRVTDDGLYSSGVSLGGLSLDDAQKKVVGGYSLSDLGSYFGDRPMASGDVSVEDMQTMGVNPAEALARSKGAAVNVDINGGDMSVSIDHANHSYDLPGGGLATQMSRRAMSSFLDAEGGPRQQIAARNAALGIVEGDGGIKYANVNGQMVKLTDQMYKSIVNRDNKAIAGTLAQAAQLQDIGGPVSPGGNAGPGVTPAAPSATQQPTFEQASMESIPEISEVAKRVMAEKGKQMGPRIAARYGDPGITPMMTEDFLRAAQKPINNVEGLNYPANILKMV